MEKFFKLFRPPFLYAIAPVILVIAVDAAFTLLGQPPEYWQGYNNVWEGSLLGAFFLSIHPLAFLGALIFEMLGIFILIHLLSGYFDRVVGIVFFIGHAWGSATWIPILVRRYIGLPLDSWLLVIIYFIILALLASFFIGLWFRDKRRTQFI